ncbi:hypothetical protein G7Y79_00050g086100 [Physcia stellaris]|nr:hypothetical protein G7Y79_00050g086100 [Physcia stellaris]
MSPSLSKFLPTHPASPATVLHAHHALYAQLVSPSSSSSPTPPIHYQPFVYPYRALGPHILILYLLLPPLSTIFSASTLRKHPWLAKGGDVGKWAVLGAITWFCTWTVLECRSRMVTVGYGIGLIEAWSVLWAWTLVCGVGARGKGMRVEKGAAGGDGEGQEKGSREERRMGGLGEDKSREVEVKGCADGGADGQSMSKGENENDNNECGKEGEPRDGLRRRKTKDRSRQDSGHSEDENVESRFVWQGLPPTLWHRIVWVTDLVTNFRGVRWSHQISGLPYPNTSSLSAFAEPTRRQYPRVTASGTGSRSNPYPSRSALLRYNLINFLLTLIALDTLKFVILKDTYYWGLPNPGPSPFPFERTSRLLLSLASIYASLNIIFILSPLVFACFAGERLLGEHGWPWLYPPLFGSPQEIWRKGLAGFWGGWWHQMFRLAFEQLGEAVAKPLGWGQRTVKGGILRVVVAFLASGMLHAAASYTSLGDTNPSHAYLFFAIQPFGLLAQRVAAKWMKENGIRDRIPDRIREAANFAFVFAWFWLTAPGVADDFARSGIWLYEPFPISPIRGLAGEGWWRWGGSWVYWHSDEKWWKSGLAM